MDPLPIIVLTDPSDPSVKGYLSYQMYREGTTLPACSRPAELCLALK